MGVRSSTGALLGGLLLFSQSLWGALVGPVSACDSVRSGTNEVVTFNVRSGGGGEIPIDAVLKKPAGAGPHPAVVVLHGSGGLRRPRCYEGALRMLAGWGYVALAMDGYTPRIAEGGYSFADQAEDAHRARAYLARLPFVHAEQIGVVGWSKGGLATLSAIQSTAGSGESAADAFKVAVAIYPICFARRLALKAPLLVLMGEEDTAVPVAACRDMRADTTTHEYRIKIYPGVGHVFDAPWHQNYDEASARDAGNTMKAFLAKYLRVPSR